MWLARDEDEHLVLFNHKPIRFVDDIDEYWISPGLNGTESEIGMEIDGRLFPNLTWEDEPIEVKLIRCSNT